VWLHGVPPQLAADDATPARHMLLLNLSVDAANIDIAKATCTSEAALATYSYGTQPTHNAGTQKQYVDRIMLALTPKSDDATCDTVCWSRTDRRAKNLGLAPMAHEDLEASEDIRIHRSVKRIEARIAELASLC
jgi:hypothetical protein